MPSDCAHWYHLAETFFGWSEKFGQSLALRVMRTKDPIRDAWGNIIQRTERRTLSSFCISDNSMVLLVISGRRVVMP